MSNLFDGIRRSGRPLHTYQNNYHHLTVVSHAEQSSAGWDVVISYINLLLYIRFIFCILTLHPYCFCLQHYYPHKNSSSKQDKFWVS